MPEVDPILPDKLFEPFKSAIEGVNHNLCETAQQTRGATSILTIDQHILCLIPCNRWCQEAVINIESMLDWPIDQFVPFRLFNSVQYLNLFSLQRLAEGPHVCKRLSYGARLSHVVRSMLDIAVMDLIFHGIVTSQLLVFRCKNDKWLTTVVCLTDRANELFIIRTPTRDCVKLWLWPSPDRYPGFLVEVGEGRESSINAGIRAFQMVITWEAGWHKHSLHVVDISGKPRLLVHIYSFE